MLPTPSAAPFRFSSHYRDVPVAYSVLFSLYVLVWFLEAGQRSALLGAIRFELILGALLGVLAAWEILRGEAPNRSALTKYIAVYFGFLLLHLPFSQFPAVSIRVFEDLILKYSCMALFLYAFVKSPSRMRLFLLVFLLSVAKIGQESLVGKVTGSMVWENQGIMRLNGPQNSIYGHPSSLAGLAVGSLPFIYCLWPVVRKKGKVLLLIMTVFAANIIIFTGSRTGYIGTLVVVGYFLLRSRARVRFVLALVLVAAIGLPLLPSQYSERFMSAFVGKEREGASKESRIELAGDAVRIFATYPLGVGIYGFRYARAREFGKIDMDTHNLYLQVLTDLGFPGMLVFLTLVTGILRELYLSERRLGIRIAAVQAAAQKSGLAEDVRAAVMVHLGDLRFLRAVAAAFLGYVVARLGLGLFGHDLYEMYWWLASGASMAIVNMMDTVDQRTAELQQACEVQQSRSSVPLGASMGFRGLARTQR
jgi:putative inorganic carbon (hco3(-)) transporter